MGLALKAVHMAGSHWTQSVGVVTIHQIEITFSLHLRYYIRNGNFIMGHNYTC